MRGNVRYAEIGVELNYQWQQRMKSLFLLDELADRHDCVRIVSVLLDKATPAETGRHVNSNDRNAFVRREQVGTPSMDFGQMTLGSQRGSSFLARLGATTSLWTWPLGEAVPTEWTES